jgi:hypothetical protein
MIAETDPTDDDYRCRRVGYKVRASDLSSLIWIVHIRHTFS